MSCPYNQCSRHKQCYDCWLDYKIQYRLNKERKQR